MFRLLLLLLVSGALGYGPESYNGTTPNLQWLFLGRCAQYQQVDETKTSPGLQVSLDCLDVWNVFNHTFASRNACELKETDYDPFFKKLNSTVPLVNQTMFWSGTKEIVHDFTHVNTNYVTLEDTFPGYVANGLMWCGCKSCEGGIDYDSCPTNCTVTSNPFWDHASRWFARKASGVAYVMVNGTQGPGKTAYWRGTTFGRVELVSMKNVTELKILVMFDVDVPRKESCGTGTLVDLVSDAHSLGIKTQCFDDPGFVNPILCVKYPHAERCKLVKASTMKVWRTVAIATIASTSVLIVVVVILLVCLRRKGVALSRMQFQSLGAEKQEGGCC